MATLYVDCPCCGARIEADRESGKVLQHWAKREAAVPGDPLKAAMEKLEADKKKRENFFSNAKQALEARKREAMEKFEKERRRIAEEGDNTPPPRPFDFD